MSRIEGIFKVFLAEILLQQQKLSLHTRVDVFLKSISKNGLWTPLATLVAIARFYAIRVLYIAFTFV